MNPSNTEAVQENDPVAGEHDKLAADVAAASSDGGFWNRSLRDC